MESRVAVEEGQENRVAVKVKEGELMLCNKWFCK